MQIQVHAAGDGELTFAIFEAFASEVDRDQGRRARCVNRHARSIEIKEIGDTIRDRPGQSGGTNIIPTTTFFWAQQMIGVRSDSDEDAHVCASCLGTTFFQATPGVPRILNGGPDGLQEQTLLRINDPGLLSGNLEEMGVELVIVAQEATPFAVDFSIRGGCRIRMLELLTIPASWRYQIDQVSPLFQVVPVFNQICRVRGEPMKADDCYWPEVIFVVCDRRLIVNGFFFDSCRRDCSR